ncbi:DUF2269 domain-containing protein [Lederbergia sp. NSJ-179]|uniref:DUF2269 family protein n=1 Tax=Lederbergia sp. NSJ-179 TaxID=2931402 RepID=UPI001FD0513A|nr:DUF2269 family protein [Lederbergia sp. NSJ-179]MCJ7840152.1 DUF2269 domain-containing protein [Lederbergia sp. NSJ-179]
MNTFYTILVFIHIFSAILGMGPGFVLSMIPKSAQTMTELRHAYKIKHHLHILVMIGGTLLLITGLLMGMIHPYLFRMGWYLVSLFLFFVALAMGPFVLKPLSIPVKETVNHHQGEEIPKEYTRLSKRLGIYENVENFLFLIIIALMILKPF